MSVIAENIFSCMCHRKWIDFITVVIHMLNIAVHVGVVQQFTFTC